MHVHVSHPDGEAKFWLKPDIELATQTGLAKHLFIAEEESLRRGGRMWRCQVTVHLTVPLPDRLRRPPRIDVNPSGDR
jgi:hypothetical protein